MIKAPTKFIIKSRPSAKENRIEYETENEIKVGDDDVEMFISHMIQKSKRLCDMFMDYNIINEKMFC